MTMTMIRSDNEVIEVSIKGSPVYRPERIRLLQKLAVKLGLFDIAQELGGRK